MLGEVRGHYLSRRGIVILLEALVGLAVDPHDGHARDERVSVVKSIDMVDC